MYKDQLAHLDSALAHNRAMASEMLEFTKIIDSKNQDALLILVATVKIAALMAKVIDGIEVIKAVVENHRTEHVSRSN